MTPEIRDMRRSDRSKDEDWIRRFLRETPFGVLTMVRDGEPYPHPNLFAFDEERDALYFHTARKGATRSSIEEDGRVAFCVSRMGRLLPDDEALEFSVEYSSVVVYGRGVVVTEPAEAERGLEMIMEKYAPHLEPGKDYRPIHPEEVKRTAVYRLDIEAWSGKEKAEAPDFPGAYRFEEVAGGAGEESG